MPFVQRVVTPIYISRAKKPTRQLLVSLPPASLSLPLSQCNTSTASTCTTLMTTNATGTAVVDDSSASQGNTPPATTTTTTTMTVTVTMVNGVGVDDIDAGSSAIPLPSSPPSPPLPPPPPPALSSDPPETICVANAPSRTYDPATALSIDNDVHSTMSPSPVTTTSTCVVTARGNAQARPLHSAPTVLPLSDDSEFDAVTNRTLSNALRQLASLMLIANDIFAELHNDLQAVGGRTADIGGRVERLARRVDVFDPKLVAVPESDLATFVQIKNHFHAVPRIQTGLFTPTTRPEHVRQLYEAAAKTPVDAIDEMARLSGRRDRSGSDAFLCTPVLGQIRRRMRTNVDVEIETRMPAAIDDLRRWTSTEAIGDITVTPDCMARVVSSMHHSSAVSQSHSLALSSIHGTTLSASSSAGDATDNIDATAMFAAVASSTAAAADVTDDMPLDHRLPSPEEQCHLIAMRFPAEVIRVDTSGRIFQRMCSTRKSMLNVPVSSRQSRRAATATLAADAASSATNRGATDADAIVDAATTTDNGDEIEMHPQQAGVKRRSRSRKPRNKRRNTIAGTDQREIEEAAKGDADGAHIATSPTDGSTATTTSGYATIGNSGHTVQSLNVTRSKSSDILKRDSADGSSMMHNNNSSSSSNATKTTSSHHRLSHFNTLKQWGRNRLRLAMQSTRNSGDATWASTPAIIATDAAYQAATAGAQQPSSPTNPAGAAHKVSDADADVNVYETCISKSKRKFLEKERRLSHERKPSYSSSEKSLACTITSSSTAHSTSSTHSAAAAAGILLGALSANSGANGIGVARIGSAGGAAGGCVGGGGGVIGMGGAHAALINPVKLRESSALRRQRRCGLGHKDELNSSSGNWSASSESGRTSIGSELTVPPKSSASSTSLNHSHISGHSQSTMGGGGGGSGPPSSIISRRRFLNTSASSSVTSDGTVTPDIQMSAAAMLDAAAAAMAYDDDGTSSAYSCDTEGYYTSFHVDSGLKTLKEEEAPMTPLHTSSALSSTNSFGSSSNKTVLSAADEYELFGKGSTSTTASSAGTVCTQLMGHSYCSDQQQQQQHQQQQQQQRFMSTSMTNSSTTATMVSPSVPERKSSLTKLNRSNSTTSNSTLERSCSSSTVGSTLERTGTIKRNGVLVKKSATTTTNPATATDSAKTIPSQVQRRLDSADAMNHEPQSESSDFEGVERVERIRSKTAINTSRIPSLCVITPSNSDDDDGTGGVAIAQLHTQMRARHASPPRAAAHAIPESEYSEINEATPPATSVKPIIVGTELKREYFKRSTLLPLNSMLGRLKGVLPHLHKKSPSQKEQAAAAAARVAAHNDTDDYDADPIYDHAGDGGEYVTIADVTNNNQMKRQTSGGYYYSNDLLKQNLATVLAGNLNEETEYVSLNELPVSPRRDQSQLSAAARTTTTAPNMFGDYAMSSSEGSTPGEEKINTALGQQQRAPAKVGELSSLSNAAAGGNEEGVARTRHSDAAEAANASDTTTTSTTHADETAAMLLRNRGARVTLDANGKAVYNSDSLKRRKGAHTTFAPGPFVKDIAETEAVAAEDGTDLQLSSADAAAVIVLNPEKIAAVLTTPKRQATVPIRPVVSQSLHRPIAHVHNNPKPSTSVNESAPFVAPVSNSDSSVVETTSGHNDDDDDDENDDDDMLQTAFTQQQQQQQVQLTDFRAVGQAYPLSSRDTTDAGPAGYARPHQSMSSATLPRRPSAAAARLQPFVAKPAAANNAAAKTAMMPHIPFQRADNAYWTLQLRKPSLSNQQQQQQQQPTATAAALAPMLPARNHIEELYATPHKPASGKRPSAEQLRPTAHGFNHYFSPIAKAADATNAAAAGIGISPIEPRALGAAMTDGGAAFRTSTPTRSTAIDASSSPLSSLTDELRYKLHVQQQLQQQHNMNPSRMEGNYSASTSSLLNAVASGSPFAANSPLSSGRSTPSYHQQRHHHHHQLEPQQPLLGDPQAHSSSCSDRLGTPKTTLHDFKKLLLSKATGKTAPAVGKPSAVEQLRIAKQAAAAASSSSSAALASNANAASSPALNASLNIIDLSGSPRTFANRRMIRQGNFGSPSKGKGAAGIALLATATSNGALLPTASSTTAAASNAIVDIAPRATTASWKYSGGISNNYRSNVMATAIPEAHSEEDTSNGSASASSDASSAVTTIETSASASSVVGPAEDSISSSSGALVVGSPTASTGESDTSASSATTGSSSAASTASASSQAADSTSASSDVGIVADNINLKTNIFLQAEENNFMRGELGTKSLSRAQMAQARADFLAVGGGGPGSSSRSAGGILSAPGSPLLLQQQQHKQQRLAQFKNGHYTGLSPSRTLPAIGASGSGQQQQQVHNQFRANTEAILDTNGEGVPTPSLETAL